MAEISIKVVIDDAHLDQTETLSHRCEELGLHVQTVIPEIGTIFGTADESLLDKLCNLEGVENATTERGYQLPPMSEDVPQ